MRFRLLGREYTRKIKSYVFEDLGFLELLRNFYDDKEINFLLDIFELIPSSVEIKLRQEILTDVLNDQDDLFTKMHIYLIKLEKYYSLFNEEVLEVRYLYFLNLMAKSIEMINHVKDCLNKLDLTSRILIDFKVKINQLETNESFHQFIKAIEATKIDIQAVYQILVNRENDQVSLYNQKGNSLTNELVTLCEKLNIPHKHDSLDLRNQRLHHTYLSSIIKVYNNEFKLLKQFYRDYHELFNKDVLNLQKDLEYFLLLKRIYFKLDEEHIQYCCPKVEDQPRLYLKNGIDLSLLNKVEKIISNDYELNEEHYIQIITGVNSGGKTSYLKGIGISYLLFLGGAFVPGSEAAFYPFKNFFTHFPSNEDYEVGSGRLSDEEIRIEAMRKFFLEEPLIILNETYSSTYESKAINKSFALVRELIEKKVFCLYVTHQHKLFETINDSYVEKLSPIVDQNANNKRLYKIKPNSSGVKSYAQDILFQYGLTKTQLERMGQDEI